MRRRAPTWSVATLILLLACLAMLATPAGARRRHHHKGGVGKRDAKPHPLPTPSLEWAKNAKRKEEAQGKEKEAETPPSPPKAGSRRKGRRGSKPSDFLTEKKKEEEEEVKEAKEKKAEEEEKKDAVTTTAPKEEESAAAAKERRRAPAAARRSHRPKRRREGRKVRKPASAKPAAPKAPPTAPAKAKKSKARVVPHHLRPGAAAAAATASRRTGAKAAAVASANKVLPPSKRQKPQRRGAAASHHSAYDEAISETLCVVKIPTGSPKAAWEARAKLDRAGLGMRYDHGRFLHEIEAYIPAPELERLVDPNASPLPGGAAAAAGWEVVRNVTRREVVGSGTWLPPSNAGAQGKAPLPIRKNRYHGTAIEMERVMRAMVRKWPRIASVQSLGRSLRGEVIWGLKIAGSSPEEHPHARGERNHPGDHWKPLVLFTGALHGDDVVGREMCLWLAEYLCEMYQSSSAVRSLLNRMAIFVIPDPSPDASVVGDRYTTRHADIDRGFPERVLHRGDPAYPERENEALMQWMLHNRPIASATFIGGGGGPGGAKTIVRYPWNGVGGELVIDSARQQRNVYRDGMEMPTPDDRAFRHLARIYAMTHTTMGRNDPRLILPKGRGGVDASEAGIVNGAKWYPRFGTLQDWIYEHTGSLHFDLLVSPHLKPLPDRLALHWDHNRRAILTFLRTLDSEGVRGTVRDARTGEAVPDAKVMFRDMNDHKRRLHSVATDSDVKGAGALSGHARGGGHFARYLQPGRYAVWAEAPGYRTSKQQTFVLSKRAPIFDVNIKLAAG